MKNQKNLHKNQTVKEIIFRENVKITKEELNKKFDKLYEENQRWKIKKQQLRQQRQIAKSLQEQKICTFKPSVNPELFFQSKQSFLKRQISWVNKKQNKVQALIQESQKKMKKQCSFKPKIIGDQIKQQKETGKNYNNIYQKALKGSSKNSYKQIHNTRISNNLSQKSKMSNLQSLQISRNIRVNQYFQTTKNLAQVRIEEQKHQNYHTKSKQRLSTDCDVFNKQELQAKYNEQKLSDQIVDREQASQREEENKNRQKQQNCKEKIDSDNQCI